uniref:Uncharacterized protein n=1 Tax=Romanomermis culicivorax TaxID=13658 RepID=A0A915K8Y6_ROMCU
MLKKNAIVNPGFFLKRICPSLKPKRKTFKSMYQFCFIVGDGHSLSPGCEEIAKVDANRIDADLHRHRA